MRQLAVPRRRVWSDSLTPGSEGELVALTVTVRLRTPVVGALVTETPATDVVDDVAESQLVPGAGVR